jgi:outer membrane cobalamin receptor
MALLETRRAEVVLAALVVAVSGVVHADEPAPAAAPVYVEEVVVDAPARLVDTWSTAADPASVEVLDGKRLRESGARSIQEALERLGGSRSSTSRAAGSSSRSRSAASPRARSPAGPRGCRSSWTACG